MQDLQDYWNSTEIRRFSNSKIGRAFRIYKKNRINSMTKSLKFEIKNFINYLKCNENIEISIQDTSFLFNTSISTVRRALSSGDDTIFDQFPGGKSKLNSNQSDLLIKWIEKKTLNHDPPDRSEVTYKAQKILELDGIDKSLSRIGLTHF